jgi:hypothetical protein
MKRIRRRCLACEEAFLSWGPANRLCRRCRRANGVEEHIPGTQDAEDDDPDLYALLRRCPERRARRCERRPAAGDGPR